MKDDVCIGCKRTLEEIRDWSKLSNDEKMMNGAPEGININI
jgi:predicted Fe-S protein YdhL (DUF1289 family)